MRKRSVVILVLTLIVISVSVKRLWAQTASPTASLTAFHTSNQDPTPLPTPTIDPEIVLLEAQHAQSRAEEALEAAMRVSEQSGVVVEYVGLVLTIGGVVVTLVGAGLGFLGFRSQQELLSSRRKIEQLGDEYQALIQSAEEDIGKAKRELQEEGSRLQTEIRDLLTEGVEASAGKLTDQLEEFRKKTEDTMRALLLSDLGVQQFRAGNSQVALRSFQEAHNLDPDNQTVNYLLGELYILQMDLDAAIKHLRLALKQDEGLAPAMAALGLAKRLQARGTVDETQRLLLFSQAEEHLLRAIQFDPSVRDATGESVYGTLGGLYRRQGRMAEAIRCYAKAGELTPLSSYPLVNLGLIHAAQGEVQESKAYFSRALQVASTRLAANPFDIWAHFDLAMSYLALGDREKGLEELELAVREPPGASPAAIVLDTLREFQDTPNPPEGLDEAIQLVCGALAHETDALNDRV